MKMKLLALFMSVVMLLSVFVVGISAESLTVVPDEYVGIYTKDDLNNIKLDMSGKYILMNDIVFEDSDYEEGGSFYNSGKGWEPIGSNSGGSFRGTFDGNGYEIINLKINNPNVSYQGLFGYVYNAEIKNLKLSAISIAGNYYVGGVVGYSTCETKISNCVVDGNISGENYVGGICGYMDPINDTSRIITENCINLANISGESDVGGVCGCIRSIKGNDASILRCINTGSISGNLTHVGGICGVTTDDIYYYGEYSSISHCYNTGNISGAADIGGILGGGYSFSIGNCYSVGNITAQSTTKGAAGGITTGSWTKSYYLDESIDAEIEYEYNLSVSKKSQDQMIKQPTYEGWDFDTIWTMEGREDYPYPELRDVPLVFPDDSKTEISGTVTVKGEAKVGSTLTAEITDVTPADATFEYEWKVDGKIVSTDATYTVTQDDVGKNITLTVKGNGDFKGDFSSSAIIGECVHSVAEYTDNNDATCDKNETKSGVCEKCNATVIEEIEDSMLPHTFINYIYDNNATCTADGTKTAKCENCNATDTITAENTMVEHDFSDGWTIDKEATCTEEGIKSHHCKDCTATKDETVLNKLAHIYIADINEATCCEDGEIIYTCSCGDTYSTIIYATGHIDNDGDEYCDECLESLRNVCPCVCHSEDSLISFFQRIIRFLRSLFGLNFCRQCKCPYV